MSPSPKSWTQRVSQLRDLIFVILGAGFIIFCLWWMLSRIGKVVLVVIFAVMFEITLSPLVDRLALRWKRPWAVLVVVASAFLVLVVGGSVLGALMTGQVVSLIKKIPPGVQHLQSVAPGFVAWLNHNDVHVNPTDIENKIFNSAGKFSSVIISSTFSIVSNLINGVVDGAITLFVTIYLLLDAHRIQVAILRLVPEPHRDLVLSVEHTLTRVIGGYVRGQLLLSLLVGSAFGLGTWAIGLPYPLVIGLVAAVMELIPLLGPILGALLPFILALFNQPWVHVPELLVLLAAVHLLESQVVGPRIIRNQVGLHPVLSVLALMIGADWQGVLGALFAVPAAGIIVAAWVAGVRLWREKVVLPSQTDEVTILPPPE